MNDGQAVSITVTFCQLLGLAGFFAFFKKMGFSQNIAALSVAFILCQQLYEIPYVSYNGGEVILFAFIGWFLFGCASIEKILNLKALCFMLLAGWVGFFCKSAFLWMYLAGLTFVWIRLSGGSKVISTWIKNGIFIALPAILSLTAIYLFFLSQGKNPASDARGWVSLASAFKLSWLIFFFPSSAPVLTNFSIYELANGLFNYKLYVVFPILMATSVLSIYLIVAIIRRVPGKEYKLLVTVFYVACILFFGLCYLRRASISYEGRHMRTLGLITIPGMIYLVLNARVFYRVLFGVICLGIFSINISYLLREMTINNNGGVHITSGATRYTIDAPALNYIASIDKQNKENIFVAPVLDYYSSSLYGVQNCRIINYRGELYKGHAGPIFILVPFNYNATQVAGLLNSFPGYKNFSMKKLNNDFTIYSSK